MCVCAFIPFCEPLHSAEADVLTSRGSDRESRKSLITTADKGIKTQRHTDIKHNSTHIPTHSHTLCAFQTHHASQCPSIFLPHSVASIKPPHLEAKAALKALRTSLWIPLWSRGIQQMTTIRLRNDIKASRRCSYFLRCRCNFNTFLYLYASISKPPQKHWTTAVSQFHSTH